MNNIDKLFYKAQNIQAKFQGQTIKYYYEQNSFIELKVVFSDKRLPTSSNNGNTTRYTQLYFSLDGNKLKTQDTVPQLITPDEDHYIIYNDIRFDLCRVNNNYYQSSIANGNSGGLLKVWVVQTGDSEQ